MQYKKANGTITKNEFLRKAKQLKSFSSSRGQRYIVDRVDDNIMFFKRLDSKNPDKLWDLNLDEVYNAFINLKDFQTANFKKYVPIRHSPARGMLIHMKLLEPK